MTGSPRVILVSLFGLLEIIQVIGALASRSGDSCSQLAYQGGN